MISEIIWHAFNHDSTETEHVMNFKKWSPLMVLTYVLQGIIDELKTMIVLKKHTVINTNRRKDLRASLPSCLLHRVRPLSYQRPSIQT